MTWTWSLFQVMVQPHNRHMSFSIYISVLAVADTVVLLGGKWICLSVDITYYSFQTQFNKNSFKGYSFLNFPVKFITTSYYALYIDVIHGSNKQLLGQKIDGCQWLPWNQWCMKLDPFQGVIYSAVPLWFTIPPFTRCNELCWTFPIILPVSGGHFTGHWYNCFRLLVTSPLGFKARVASLSHV